MRILVVVVLVLVLAAPVAAQDVAPTVRLRAEVVVHGAQVRWMDLADGPIDSELARQVVVPAPAPGHDRTWSQDQLMREIVRNGAPVVPRLAGSGSVRIVRPGRRIEPDALADRIRRLIEDRSPPGEALDQRIEILRLPTVHAAAASVDVRLEDEGPRVGRGAVAVRVDGRRLYAMVRRSVRVPVLRARQALDAHRGIDLAAARVDTVWTDDARVLDRTLPVTAADGSWTLLRSVPGDHVITVDDVRATPVVRRGELVHWIVEGDGLRVQVRARARNDGAVGEWISVESPFDNRLRRVVVTGPGRVADHPPEIPGSHGTQTGDDS